MKHIIEKWQENICESKLWDFYFKGMHVGVLDIETTGLKPLRDKFILGGLYDVAREELHQVLIENRSEEATALAEFASLLAGIDVIVTYNGRRFDIPFITERFRACGTEGYARQGQGALDLRHGIGKYDLDLYRLIKGYSGLKAFLPNLKQKTVEDFMGLWDKRTDEISGADSVDLFYRYEATRDEEAEKRILLHNNDDVRQLTRLTQAIKKCDFHKAMSEMGFPLTASGYCFVINDIKLKQNELKFAGSCRREKRTDNDVEYRGFEFRDSPMDIKFHDGKFEFRLPLGFDARCDGLAIVDLVALGIETEDFARYTGYGSGFLIIGDRDGMRCRETNHLIMDLIREFVSKELA